MKFLTLLLFFLSLNLQAQIKIYKYDRQLTCDAISSGITDSILYELKNGRIYIKEEEWRKNKMKKLIVNNKFYYISEKLADLVAKAVQENNCTGIVIKEMDIPRDFKIIRD